MDQLMNAKLVQHQNDLRKEIDQWAKAQTSSINAACARYEFEEAVLMAIRRETAWQEHTNSDLCAALGHTTLYERVREII